MAVSLVGVERELGDVKALVKPADEVRMQTHAAVDTCIFARSLALYVFVFSVLTVRSKRIDSNAMFFAKAGSTIWPGRRKKRFPQSIRYEIVRQGKQQCNG